MRTKSEAFNALTAYIAQMENQLGKTVKEVRSDGGSEFKSIQAQKFYANKGIIHLIVPPDAHAQNGQVERPHRTILANVRTLLSDSQWPKSFWAEAALYTVYTRNRLPRSDGTIPIAKSLGTAPVYRRFEPFGNQCWFRDHTCTSKLDNRYKAGRLQGTQVQVIHLDKSGIPKIARPLSRVTAYFLKKNRLQQMQFPTRLLTVQQITGTNQNRPRKLHFLTTTMILRPK